MVVRSSNLALRFYRSDGWSQQLLATIIKPEYRDLVGTLLRDSMGLGDSLEASYFIFMPSAYDKIDFDLLCKLKTKLIRAFNDIPSVSDEQFMRIHL